MIDFSCWTQNDAAPFTKIKVNGDKQCQIPLTTVVHTIIALYFKLYDALLCEVNISTFKLLFVVYAKSKWLQFSFSIHPLIISSGCISHTVSSFSEQVVWVSSCSRVKDYIWINHNNKALHGTQPMLHKCLQWIIINKWELTMSMEIRED